jgi:hypothetical protein
MNANYWPYPEKDQSIDNLRFTFLTINNNNNIYLLQMGCHPVAVITLHVFPNTATKFT